MGTPFFRHVGVMSYPSAGAGAATRLLMPRTALWERVQLQLYGTLDVTGIEGGTTLVDGAERLLRSLQVVGAGSQSIKTYDGPMLRNANLFDYGVLPNTVTVPATAVDTELNSHLTIPFAMPRAVRPFDTFFNAPGWSLLELVSVWGDENDLVDSPSVATYDFSDLVLSVDIEENVGESAAFGVFTEQMLSQSYSAVTGVQQFQLPEGHFYRSLLMRAENATTNPADNIVEQVSVRSGSTRWREGLGWGDDDAATQLRGSLNGQNQMLYGIDVPVGYRQIDFAPDGLLTQMLDTNPALVPELFIDADVGTASTTGKLTVLARQVINPRNLRA